MQNLNLYLSSLAASHYKLMLLSTFCTTYTIVRNYLCLSNVCIWSPALRVKPHGWTLGGTV